MRYPPIILIWRMQVSICLVCILILSSLSLIARDRPPENFVEHSIFSPGDSPSNPLVNDGNALEFGVKIRVTEPGLVRAIRFYKGLSTSGTDTGNIWTSTGVNLASAIFVSETDSGWQQVMLSSPVALDTGITYIVSCFSSSGDYGFTPNYFTTNIGTGSVIALANGVDGGNGVYKYGTTSVFPDQSYNSSNYFVDVVFSPGIAGGILTGTSNFITKFDSPSELTNSVMYDNGYSVGVGTMNISDTSYRLYVEKGIRTRRVKVDHSNWPDYVFGEGYNLIPLDSVELFIHQRKHLPGVSSADEIHTNGLDIGEQQGVLLRKLEELTLYIIDLKKEVIRLQKEVDRLKTTR